jgi:hypothetical protein
LGEKHHYLNKRRNIAMKRKTLTSAVVLTFAVVLSFMVGILSPAQAGNGRSRDGARRAVVNQKSILDSLGSTTGTEVLLAVIQVVDQSAVCPIQVADLLDDRNANLVVLAPGNRGFEVFLNLNPGTLAAWDVETIARVIPGLIAAQGLNSSDLCNLLAKHISMGERNKPKTLSELLEQGFIVMLDESEYPVAVGGGRGGGICINYDACITQPDVKTQNGVIHYLAKVLQRPPVEEPPVPEGIDAWCSQGKCGEDVDLHNECVEEMETCLLASESNDECFGASLLMCSQRDGLFGGDGLFDDDGIFD